MMWPLLAKLSMLPMNISHSSLFSGFFDLEMMRQFRWNILIIFSWSRVRIFSFNFLSILVFHAASAKVNQFLLVCSDDGVSMLVFHIPEGSVGGV